MGYQKLLFLLICCAGIQASLFAQCFQPISFRLIGTDTSSAEFQWAHASADSFEIELIKTSGLGQQTISLLTDAKTIKAEGLISGTSYTARIRAFCGNNISSWTSRLSFVTVIVNRNGQCRLDLRLENNNCPSQQVFKVLVDNAGGNALGTDVDFVEVRMLVEHDWPSDLAIKLRSPSGKTISLSEHRGLGRRNFGNPAAPDCGEPLIFSPFACISITSPLSLLRGAVLPEDNFSILSDGSDPNGIWEIIICDNHVANDGVLEFLELGFSLNSCTPPTLTYLQRISHDQIIVRTEDIQTCEQLIFELVPEGNSPGINLEKGHPDNILVMRNCFEGVQQINGLTPGSLYTLFIRSQCGITTFSENNCGTSLQTLCSTPAYISEIDSLDLCTGICADVCEVDSLWSNKNTEGFQWTVHSGTTPTANIGPDGDFYGNGKYLYIEASDPNCADSGPAVLESSCISWPENTEVPCALSFAFHISGDGAGSLNLLSSSDGGINWDTAWSFNGISPSWQLVELDIQAFIGRTNIFRFVGIPSGPLNDIAIDELIFYEDAFAFAPDFRYYADKDMDGYGDPNDFIVSCISFPPSGYVRDSTDCDDTNPDINPGMDEIPCNLIDDNCSGVIDDSEESIEIMWIQVVDATCKGLANGSIRLEIMDHGKNYTVSWNHGATGIFVNLLSEGFYTATVTDEDGCQTISDSIYVGAAPGFEIDLVTLTQNQCNGISDGIIEVSGFGGVEPYAYFWEDTLLMDPIRTDLNSGIYTSVVRDARGCIVSRDIILNPLNELSIQLLEITDPTCPDRSDGVIRIRVNSPNLPLTYQWSNQMDEPSIRNLPAGVYHVTVTDSQGCFAVKSYNLNSPDPITVQIIAVDPVQCPGGFSGRIAIQVNGGNGGYTFNWSNGQQQFFSQNLNQIRAGSYSLTVSDQKNCMFMLDNVMVEEPAPFLLEHIEIANNKCLLTMQGSITPQISGGTPGYLYFWSNGFNAESIEQLATGRYMLTITDQRSCKHTFESWEVESSNIPLEVSILNKRSPVCFGEKTGSIVLEVFEGTAPYSYLWSNGIFHQGNDAVDSLTNLGAGNYSVTITDHEGCTGNLSSIALNGPSTPLAYILQNIVHITCHGEQNGAIDIEAIGGIPPYTYNWSNAMQSDKLEGLTSGLYSSTITDFAGCTLEINAIQIEEPEKLNLTIDVLDESCQMGQGHLRASALGGKAPYSYTWYLNGNTFSGSSINELSCGLVNLVVMDFNMCTADTSFMFGTTSTKTYDKENRAWTVYPNPAKEHIIIDFNKHYELPQKISLHSLTGQLLKEVFIDKSSNQITIPLHEFPPGLYLLRADNIGHSYKVVISP